MYLYDSYGIDNLLFVSIHICQWQTEVYLHISNSQLNASYLLSLLSINSIYIELIER